MDLKLILSGSCDTYAVTLTSNLGSCECYITTDLGHIHLYPMHCKLKYYVTAVQVWKLFFSCIQNVIPSLSLIEQVDWKWKKIILIN